MKNKFVFGWHSSLFGERLFSFLSVKKKLIQILLISLCFIAGCGRCKDDKMTYNAMSNKIYEYSHMFREGNWWIYANQDSSKLDTMFVTEFKDSTIKEYDSCTKNQIQTFKLHSKYFLGNLGIVYGEASVKICKDFESLLLERRDSITNNVYSDATSIVFSNSSEDNKVISLIVSNGDTLRGICNPYSNGYSGGAFIKNIGVSFYSNSTFSYDTFHLIKYHIQ